MTDNLIQAAIDAGIAQAAPHAIDLGARVHTIVVPADASHVVVDTEQYQPTPDRAKSVYRPATVDALVAVITRHHDPASTTIWVHPESGQVVAVFNDAAPGTPGWRDHRAQLDLQQTKEWRHWVSRDGSLMSQVEFAEHIEDGLPELVTPPAADMLELAQSFQATQGATFRSAHRLQDGRVQAQYDEEVTASAGQSGQLAIPNEFLLSIAPFLGEAPYGVTARLRYRLGGGNLKIGYRLVRPDAVVRDALDHVAGKLAASFPAVFIGTPGLS